MDICIYGYMYICIDGYMDICIYGYRTVSSPRINLSPFTKGCRERRLNSYSLYFSEAMTSMSKDVRIIRYYCAAARSINSERRFVLVSALISTYGPRIIADDWD